MTSHRSVVPAGALGPGDHACCVYRVDDEFWRALVPYVAAGIARGEKVVLTLSADTTDALRPRLAEAGLAVGELLAAGRLACVTPAEAGMGEGADPREAGLGPRRKILEEALAQGYPALRVAVDVAWTIGPTAKDDTVLSLARADEAFARSPLVRLCFYDLRRCRPEAVLHALSVHPLTVVGPGALQNPLYVPPSEATGPNRAAAMVDGWLSALQSRARLETSLAENSQLLRALFSGPFDLLALVDARGNVVRVSESMARQVGVPRQSLTDAPVSEASKLLDPGTAQARLRHIARVFETGQPIRAQDQRNGVWFDNAYYPVLDGDGVVCQVVVVARDVTAEKETTARLESTLSALPDLLFEVDADRRITGFRAPKPELLYVPPETFLGQTFDAVLPRAAARTIAAALDRAAVKGIDRGAVYSLDVAGGQHWFELSVARLQDGPGRAGGRGFVGLVRNVTRRVEAERAADEQRRFVDQVVSALPGVLYLFDLGTHRFVWVRGKLTTTLTGAGALEKMDLAQAEALLVPESRPSYREDIAAMATAPEGSIRQFEYEVAVPAGGKCWVRCWETPFTRGADGRVTQVLGVGLDVTEEKESHRNLAESEERLFAFLEGAVVGIGASRKGVGAYANPALVRMLGYDSPADLEGRPLTEVVAPHERARILERLARIARGEPVDPVMVMDHLRRDGDVRTFEVHTAPPLPGDELRFSQFLDITDQLRVEADLRASRDRLRVISDVDEMLDRAVRERFAEELAGRRVGGLVAIRQALADAGWQPLPAASVVRTVFEGAGRAVEAEPALESLLLEPVVAFGLALRVDDLLARVSAPASPAGAPCGRARLEPGAVVVEALAGAGEAVDAVRFPLDA